MGAARKTRFTRGAAALLAAGLALSACGEDEPASRSRPPVPVGLTGVVQENGITLSPSKVGAGPVEITVSNQTRSAHSLVLEGESLRVRTRPIAPLDTGTISETLAPGEYELRAGSRRAQPREIPPAGLTIEEPRRGSDRTLLLP